MDETKEIIEAAHELIGQADMLGCVYDTDFDKLRAALSRLESRESKKAVPIEMLEEIGKHCWDYSGLVECAARYGYEVTED